MISAKIVAVTTPVIEGVSDIKELITFCARVSNPANQLNMLTVEKFLVYLSEHKHFSPLEMANVVVEVITTRDIMRQMLRHRSFSFQEFSQRYADVSLLEQSFVTRPARKQDKKNRQNSFEYDLSNADDAFIMREWEWRQREILDLVKESYKWAIDKGVAKEVARAILPEGLTMSRAYVNGTIRSWVHYLQVRLEEGVTQKEHVMLARLIAEAVNKAFPVAEETWKIV